MLENLLGSLIDKEGIANDAIQSKLEDIAKELSCSHKDFFVMFKPINEDFDFKCYIYKMETGKSPQLVREISLKEILSNSK